MRSERRAADGWRSLRLAEIARERNQRADSGPKADVFSVTKHRGFVRSLEYFDRQVFSRDTSNYKVVRRGDLAYATIHLDEGSLGILRDADAGLISPMYTVFEVDRQQVEPAFLFALMKLPTMVARYQRIGEGSIHRRKSISFERLGRLIFNIPVIEEQRRILNVLDANDEAIERTEAVIAATERLRDSLLHELLTRGVPGWHREWKEVAGVGTVPACWEVVRLGEVAEVQTGRAVNRKSVKHWDVEIPYLSVANVKDGYLDLSAVKTMRVSTSEIDRYRLRQGDVLFTEGGDADKLGRGTVWQSEIKQCLHQNHVFAVRTRNSALQPEFLAAYAASGSGKRFFINAAKQTTNLASVNATQLRQMPIPLPDIPEQAKVDGLLSVAGGLNKQARVERDAMAKLKTSTADALLTGRLRVGDTAIG